MALITTPGAVDANSYITLDEFQAYLDTRLHVPSSVSDSDADLREAALIMATRIFDAYICFTGIASSAVQALSWPRTGMLNKHGFGLDSTIIPIEVKNALAELAFQLIISDRTQPTDAEAQGLTKLKVGPVELRFREDFKMETIADSVSSLLVKSWLCPEDEDEPHVEFDML